MNVTILGSGTNLHPNRAAAGYVIQTDQLIMLDFGPRTLQNLLRTGIDRHSIRYLLFTHHHADHVSDFITFFFDAAITAKITHPKSRRQDLTIFGPQGTRRMFGTLLRTFPSFRPTPFHVSIRDLGETSFSLGQTHITTKQMTHVPSLQCLGYRIEHGGRSFVYSGDAQYSQNLVSLCRSANVAVLDCSFPIQKAGENHMHARDCGRVAQEAGVKKLVLSHFYPVCHRYDIKAQCASVFPGQIVLARDRMRLSI